MMHHHRLVVDGKSPASPGWDHSAGCVLRKRSSLALIRATGRPCSHGIRPVRRRRPRRLFGVLQRKTKKEVWENSFFSRQRARPIDANAIKLA
jgi:hypothetical protein